MTENFPGRVAIQQRVLPSYRVPFFDLLAKHCKGGAALYSGKPDAKEGIDLSDSVHEALFFEGRNIALFDPSSPFFINWQPGLLRWLQRWQPDVLILEANARYLSSRKAIRWMKARGKPVLGWGLGSPPLHGRFASLRMRNRKQFYRSLDGIIAYSKRGAKQYQNFGVDPERIFVAYNAVTMPPSFPFPVREVETSRRLMVLFVGRLQTRKRLDLLFDACAKLPEESRPRIVVAGDGPARMGFEDYARKVYHDVHFAGAKYGAALERLFLEADLFVLPGTGGLAVQQAMSYGLPVVVARGDGTQDDLVRKENGWQIPSGDVESLTSALADALSDVRRLRQMGRESYRIVKEEINIERMAATFIRAIRQVSGV